MCMPSAFDGHKTLVCQVGGLPAGDRYRTPEGREFLRTDLISTQPGQVQVVDVSSGVVTDQPADTKLGRDRAGRLYASRSLNTPTPTAVAAVDVSKS